MLRAIARREVRATTTMRVIRVTDPDDGTWGVDADADDRFERCLGFRSVLMRADRRGWIRDRRKNAGDEDDDAMER